MDLEHHTPSLTHLRDFARARATGRRTHVAQDRAQVLAPTNDRIFAFAYERFLTGVIDYIRDGSRGSALQAVIDGASERMRASYTAAGRGVTELLGHLEVRSARRQQRNVVVLDVDGTELVSLRLHLILELHSGLRVATHLYFSEQALTTTEIGLMETAIALATAQQRDGAVPAILLVRSGDLRFIDAEAATSTDRRATLRAEADAYREEWAVSA